jgi:Uma2 family endonuclease
MESQLGAPPLSSQYDGLQMTLDEFQYANPVPDARTELVDGRMLVREPPKSLHGHVTVRVLRALLRYLDASYATEKDAGLLLSNDTGMLLRRHPDTVRAADIAYFTVSRAPVDLECWAETAPDLVVEVRSPTDRPGYLRRKVADWLTFGCQQVWVVDPAQRTVTVHEPHGVTSLSASDHLTGGALFPGFTVPVSSLCT